jgi:hypothetical protein
MLQEQGVVGDACAGLQTEVLAVAELPQIAVSETIVRVTCERDCCAVLVALITAQAER